MIYMLIEKYHNNKLVYDFIKKDVFSLKKVTVSIGEVFEGDFDVNVNIYYVNEYLLKEFDSFTPATYSTIEEAEKHAKGIYKTLVKKYDKKVIYEGLENC